MITFFLEFRNIFLFILCSFILAFILLYILSFISKVDLEKSSAYECGFQLFSETSYPFEVQFAVIAIMFFLFDIEVLYLFPLVYFLYILNYLGIRYSLNIQNNCFTNQLLLCTSNKLYVFIPKRNNKLYAFIPKRNNKFYAFIRKMYIINIGLDLINDVSIFDTRFFTNLICYKYSNIVLHMVFPIKKRVYKGETVILNYLFIFYIKHESSLRRKNLKHYANF